MKKLTVLFLSILISVGAFAQEELEDSNEMLLLQKQKTEKTNAYIVKNNLKVNVIHLLMGGINVAYERRLTNFLTVQVEGNYFFYYNYQPMQVLNLNAQLRLYPLAGKFYAPKGLYFGVVIGYGFAHGYYDNIYYYEDYSDQTGNKPEQYSRSYHSPEMGMRLGYQFVWRSGLTLDLGSGWSFFPLTKDYPGNTRSFNRYLIPAFTASLGFNF